MIGRTGDGSGVEQPVIIRCSGRNRAWLALGGLAFMAVGLWMLSAEPPSRSLVGWSTPAGRALQTVVGLLALAFGSGALGMSVLVTIRPILVLYPDRVVDVYRRLVIPMAEICSIKAVSTGGFFAVRWLECELCNPAGIARLGRAQQASRHDDKLILNLTLASESDFARAQQFIQERLGRLDIEGEKR